MSLKYLSDFWKTLEMPLFNCKINLTNKYQSKVSVQAINSHLDFWIDPSFQGENKLFVLLFENTENRTVTQKILSSKCRN